MTAEVITLYLQHVAHFNEQTLHFLSVTSTRMNFKIYSHPDLVIRGYKIALTFFFRFRHNDDNGVSRISVVYKCVVNTEPDKNDV